LRGLGFPLLLCMSYHPDIHMSYHPDILDLAESRLRPGALIVAENADHSPEYLARERSSASGYMWVPLSDDVDRSMRLD
jgi:predicted O-methyltransferase YrrM